MNVLKETSYKTTCSYCGVGCGIVIKKDRKNNLILEGDPDHPVNKGMLCSKGMNLHYAMQDTSDRLLYPEMRWSKHHPLERVSWNDAIKRAAAVFASIIKAHGPDSVGFYVSGQCLTEEYYVANKLVKGFLGTNNIDTNSRLCMSSAVAGYAHMLGEDAVPVSYEDIELADCFLIAGANPAWCHPILFRRIEAHKQNNPGIKIIVVDPRKTQSCAIADLHLQITPGTDIYLYHAIARVLIEDGEVDYNFVNQHTEDFEKYRDSVFQFTVEEAAEKCDVRVDDIRLAASYIAAAKGFLTLWAMGLNQSVIGKKFGLQGRIITLSVFLLLEGAGIMLFSQMNALPWAIFTMLLFALFLKMSNGATYSVVPFINKRAIGTVAGIVGAGGNVGAVLAGFLFTSEELSYRESLFIIGITVIVVSVISFLLSLPKKAAKDVLNAEFHPETMRMKEA